MRLPLIGILAAMLAPGANVEGGRIVLVTEKEVEAYRDAVAGLKRGLGDLAGSTTETAPDGVASTLGKGQVRMVVAIGAEARAAVAKANPNLPVVSTMLTLADISSEPAPLAKSAGAVYLDVDFGQVVREINKLFPSRKRFGVIATSRKSGPNRFVLSKLEKEGFTVQVAVSPNRAGLLGALHELKGKVDMVICLPETGLFDSRTIPSLLRVSLENQLPVVGFSQSFVKAGAVAGVFPDYSDVGQQTADLVRRALAKPTVDAGEETPRKVMAVANPTVLKLLGWKQGE